MWVSPPPSRNDDAAAAAPRLTALRALLWVVLGVVLPSAFAFFYVYRFGVNLPIHDEWNFMPTVGAFYEGGDWWSMVVEHYGEHRIVLPRLVILYLSRVTHLDVKFEEYLSVAFMAAGAYLCWRLLRRTGGPSWTIVPIGWIYLSVAQFENLLVGWQVQIPMMNFFVLVAVLLLTGAGRWRLAGAAGAAAAATFSFANGMLIWPACLPLFWWRGEGGRRVRGLAVWIAVAAATALTYRWGYQGFDRTPEGYLFTVLRKPGDAVQMFVALAGNNFGEGRVGPMLVAGTVVLAVSFAAFALLWRWGRIGRDEWPWITLWLFSAGSLFAVVVGRSFIWQQMVTPSRFLTLGIFIPITAIVLLARAAASVARLGRTWRLAAAAAGLLLVAAAVRQEWLTAKLGWDIGGANRDLKLRTVPCLLQYRTADRECLRNLYVADGELVRRRAAILERWRLGPFADQQAAAVAANGGGEATAPSPSPVQGSVDFLGLRVAGGGAGAAPAREVMVVEGWTLAGDDEPPAAMILDVDGRWVAVSAAYFRRVDVEQYFHREVPPCGWRFTLPRAQLTAGEHAVRVLALAPGASQPVPVPGPSTLRIAPALPVAPAALSPPKAAAPAAAAANRR